MAKRHLISLPAQELSALLCAVQAPQFAALFERVPAFRAALQHPIDDELTSLANEATDAIREVRGNTSYPEDWDYAQDLADRLRQQMDAQRDAQACVPSLPSPKPYGNDACTCCGGRRIVSVYAKACNSNVFSIPHLAFEVFSYMPSKLGIPGSGDGPELEVCLDCGRVVNGVYPLTDETLKARIAKYQEELL